MENLENQIPEEEITASEPETAATETLFDVTAEVEPTEESTPTESEEALEEIPQQMPEETAPAKEKRKIGGWWKGLLCAILAAASVVAGCVITANVLEERWEEKLTKQQEAFHKVLNSMDTSREPITDSDRTDSGVNVESVSGTKSPAQVYAENVNTVVMVYCEIMPAQGLQIATGYSSGSGFVISDDGYVVTNAHVVDGATNIFVTLYDNTEYRAQLVGADTVNDVALLKIDAVDLDYAVIGRSGDLIVGDQVAAIGNPLGELTSTLTVGYVSAMERDVSTDGTTINMLQTDAAINSGNSGGPLFNMNGEVVGITTAKYSGTTESGAVIEGIGFAIPIDDVYDILFDLKQYGHITGAYLGVLVSDMDPAQADYFGLPVGVYVQEATPGFCAEAAGVQAKDIIVALGEFEVSTLSELTRTLRNFSAGETTTITVFRSGQKMVLDITLDAKPNDQ